ncbi:MAG TPA: Gfo/Idh/MocA family oxidoreductase [Urbifossiella sp.]|nr:Gfo/Idh/MocA family oxidoreductase [Urbifossiella sp.]
MSSPQSADRRDFLKASAAVAGTAMATNMAGAHAAGADIIKVGLVGCGGRGRGAVKNILQAEEIINGDNPKIQIVAVADVFKDRASNAARDFSNPKHREYGPHTAQVKITPDTTFGGFDAYQKLIDSGVDLVILATPPGFRPYHLEAAIRANKNVFCEKPVAVDATGIRKVFGLAEEAKKRNLAIVAGTQRRHQKGYIETIKQIKDGAIGNVISARVAWNSGGPNPIWFNKRQEGEPDTAYQIRNWYHYLWLCGDHIVEQHVHNLDVANWVIGDHPIRATGIGGRAARPGGAVADPNMFGQIWDHFAVEYEYKNGVRVFSYCRHIAGSEGDVSEMVFGSNGSSRVGNYLIGKKQVGDDQIGGKHRDAYVQEHIDLLSSIRAGKPLNELRQVAESTFTAILGRNAAYAERWLKWDDALAANDGTMPEKLALDGALPATPAPTPGAWKLPKRA